MTGTQVALLWVYAVIVAVWPIRWIVLTVVLRRLEFLTPQSPRFEPPEPPLVTAILPAKDEEANLGDCLASVCRQTYPNLEILVVDDRSVDRTGAIARRFAARDRRIRVLTIDHLPAGWTGKTHALHQAAGRARGAWLWFLDADTLHAPEGLSIMMEYARSHRAALVSLLPELRCETFWEQVVQPLGAIVLMQSFPLHVVHRQDSPLAFANGQYLLIERSAYDAAGRHEAVRDRFVEDIALAGRVKALGLPIRVALIRGIVTCRMYASLPQLVRGWSRILYDALDRRAVRLTGRLLDPIIFSQSGHVALLAGLAGLATGGHSRFALALLGLSLIHHAGMYFVFRLVYNTSVPGSRYVGWYPLGNLVIDAILLRAIRMCLTGRVTWRGTDYGAAAKPASVDP
ncbi:MAG TPA: glycosyltransferase [Isosphaeraceae bacterium]|nr:glycosyltransferase [Isosphaeraceae bacterium]